MADIRKTIAWILVAFAATVVPIASGAEVRLLPTSARLDGPHARQRFLVERIDAGIVLLAEASGGLVSPSKFSGYINFGLPLIYLGPAATNTARVCAQFAGGFWLPTNASTAEVEQVAESLLAPGSLEAARGGARAASSYFAAFDGRSLARALAPRLAKSGKR